jgi:hypothetical protein
MTVLQVFEFPSNRLNIGKRGQPRLVSEVLDLIRGGCPREPKVFVPIRTGIC